MTCCLLCGLRATRRKKKRRSHSDSGSVSSSEEDDDSTGSSGSSSEDDSTGNAAKPRQATSTAYKLVSVPLAEQRRVISTQLHYFDHPLFGFVVQIRRYNRPDVTE